MLRGGYLERIAHRERECRQGVVLSHPAGEGHSNRHGSADVRLLTVSVGEDTRLARSLGFLRDPIEFRSTEIGHLAGGIARELANKDAAAELAVVGLSYELFACLERLSNACNESGALPASSIMKVTDLILTEPLSRYSLRELATLAGVHSSQLAKTFRNHHGMSVGAFARRARLSWARDALASSGKDLAAIAAEAGFSDQSHFTRCFKNAFGMAPGKWRQHTRLSPRPLS